MLEIILAIIIISSIAAFLAAVLTVSTRLLTNYGLCKITINDARELQVDGGDSLLNVLTENKIFIPSACGGRGTCGLCKIKTLNGAGLLLPTEEPYLDAEERENSIRLSCQIKIRNDISVEIPLELLEVGEYTCRCTEILDLTYDMKQFTFELIEPDTTDYIPGQYMQLLTPVYEKSDEEIYRAYSLSSDPAQKNVIELIIRYVPGGICTTYCFEYLNIGDTAKINGPYGQFQLTENDCPMVFVAGGSGIAPIKCMLQHMKNTRNQRKTFFYFGAQTVNDLLLLDLMNDFQNDLADFTFIPVVANPEPSDNWQGQIGLVTEALERDFKIAPQSEGYLCGSPGLVDAAIEVLTKLGMTEDKIFYDKFT